MKKKTISNVFRDWKVDSPDDINSILNNDISGNFFASSFMKDPNDLYNGLEIIKYNWKMI